jgi:hypothetical protein
MDSDLWFLWVVMILGLGLMISGYAMKRSTLVLTSMGVWFVTCAFCYMQTGLTYDALFWIALGLTITSGIEGALLRRPDEEGDIKSVSDPLEERIAKMKERNNQLRDSRRINRIR